MPNFNKKRWNRLKILVFASFYNIFVVKTTICLQDIYMQLHFLNNTFLITYIYMKHFTFPYVSRLMLPVLAVVLCSSVLSAKMRTVDEAKGVAVWS